jgi:ABC-2 type transport system permease protein
VFNLAGNLVVVFIFILAFGIDPMWTWLLFPLILGAMFAITTAVSMIVASLYPRYRDVSIIWTVAVTALFYATPVLYPIDHVSKKLRDVISLNPLAPIFEAARKWIIDPNAPGPVAATGGWARLMIPVGIFLAVCVFAVWIFNREAPRIAEEL